MKLSGLFGKAGPGAGGEVYDLTSQSTLFSLRADEKRPPASVEKIYTSVAALSKLGPSATFQTTILGTGHLSPGGVWEGDLYLRGGGDPTFGDGTFNKTWNQGYGPTAVQLIGQLKARGITRVTGHVIPDESLFDPARGGPSSDYGPDIPDLGGQLSALTYDHGSTTAKLAPPAFAAHELVLTMRAQHMQARASTQTRITPQDAQPLATVSSPPLSTLLRLMDVPSDDLYAEMLAKQLGVRYGGAGTTTAGAKVISSVIGSYDVHPTIVDGSGLSRSDSTSPAEVVALLRAIWRTPIGNELATALPTMGVNGTVQSVGLHTPAQGRCIAKTGTLNGVTNLAGYCTNRAGHVLTFAFFVDGPPNWTALTMVGNMAGVIAG